MWAPLRKLLARSRILGSSLGEVVFETSPVTGQSSHSLFQWRVKKGLDGNSLFVALRLVPDAYAGREESPTNYISFDIESAKQIRADLDRCIAEFYRLAAAGTPSRSPR
jgi:hypothetical protein